MVFVKSLIASSLLFGNLVQSIPVHIPSRRQQLLPQRARPARDSVRPGRPRGLRSLPRPVVNCDAQETPSQEEAPIEEADPTSNATGSALYWMTNEPDGNFIMSATIDDEGRLTFADAFWTGGLGGHGANQNDPEAPNPLFAQGSVTVSGEQLFVVNAGSNTVSMFNINAENPAEQLEMAGGPVPSGGEFPVSGTVSSSTGNLCVLNSGAENGVQCFSADSERGLTPIADSKRPLGLNNTTPPVGPGDSLSHILFSESGSELFVSLKSRSPGFIAGLEVSEDGSLSADFVRNAPQDGGEGCFSMTMVSGAQGPAILNADPAIGYVVYQFDGVEVVEGTGTAIDGQVGSAFTTFSPSTGNYYIADVATSVLTEVSIDTDTLESEIVNQYPQGQDHSTIDMAVATIGGKEFLYIMSPGIQSIEVLELVAPGETRAVQTFDIGAAAQEVGITVSTANLQGAAVFTSA